MTAARPRVVVVTFEVSVPPRTGGQLRSQRLMAALASHVELRVVAVEHADAALLMDATGAAHVQVFARRGGAVAARLRALLRGWPVATARWWHPRAARLVRREAQQGALIVVDHGYLDPYRPRRGRYVLSLHNVDSRVVGSLPAGPGARRRVERWWDARTIRRMESRACRRERADVVAVSSQDAVAFGRPAAAVVENGTDIPAHPGPRPSQGLLLFVGSLTWPPNLEAVRWWATHVAPRLDAGLPRLTVIGRGGHAGLAGVPGLDVLDEVEDIADFMHQARVVVAPLQHGGGTRLKVVEAMAWRRPVVSTSKGAEGIPVEDGVHLLIADTPDAFAQAVARLWVDDELADRLTAASAPVASAFDWRDLGVRFTTFVLGHNGG